MLEGAGVLPEDVRGQQRGDEVPDGSVRSAEEHSRSRRRLWASRTQREAGKGAKREDRCDSWKHCPETN